MLLMLANLMKRDPRMVERKKTGLAKARKAVCHLASFWYALRCADSVNDSTPGSSGSLLRRYEDLHCGNSSVLYTHT